MPIRELTASERKQLAAELRAAMREADAREADAEDTPAEEPGYGIESRPETADMCARKEEGDE